MEDARPRQNFYRLYYNLHTKFVWRTWISAWISPVFLGLFPRSLHHVVHSPFSIMITPLDFFSRAPKQGIFCWCYSLYYLFRQGLLGVNFLLILGTFLTWLYSRFLHLRNVQLDEDQIYRSYSALHPHFNSNIQEQSWMDTGVVLESNCTSDGTVNHKSSIGP